MARIMLYMSPCLSGRAGMLVLMSPWTVLGAVFFAGAMSSQRRRERRQDNLSRVADNLLERLRGHRGCRVRAPNVDAVLCRRKRAPL